MPGSLFMGLLIRAPNPDGDHYEELAAPAYCRQELRLTSYDARHLTNLNAVSFAELMAGEVVSMIGLFDDQDRLAFYGHISGARASTSPARRFYFRAYDVRVRKVQPTSQHR